MGSIGDTKCSSNLTGEVNVTGRIDQVNQETSFLSPILVLGLWLCDEGKILLFHIEEHRNSRGFDGDAAVLFILPGVRGSSFSSLGRSNNPSLCNKRVCKSRLAVIDMSDHRHVPDVLLLVHKLPDFVDREVHHLETKVSSLV